jgi:hypothetical protein
MNGILKDSAAFFVAGYRFEGKNVNPVAYTSKLIIVEHRSNEHKYENECENSTTDESFKGLIGTQLYQSSLTDAAADKVGHGVVTSDYTWYKDGPEYSEEVVHRAGGAVHREDTSSKDGHTESGQLIS